MFRKKITRMACAFTCIVLLIAILSPFVPSKSITEEVYGTPTGWTDDIRITDFSNNDVKVAISVDESDVCLAWERTVVVSSDYEVYFVKSNDSGESWNSPQQISNSGIYATKPDINVNNSHLHIVWSDWKTPDWEIFYRNSTDGGETWNPEKRISIDDGNSSEGPRIAVNNSHIHVVWVDARLAQTEVYYKRSTDGGISWDDGLGNPDIDRRITHDLSGAAPAGIGVNASNIHVLFSDDRDGSPDVYYIRSIDNGATWDDGLGNVDEERKLTSNSTWHMASRMAVYGPTIHVVWADQVWPGPVYYLYYRKSTDNGVTWNPIQLLTGPTPVIASPDIAVWEDRVDVVWDDMRDDGTTTEVYYKNSTDGGISWSADIRLTCNESYDSLWPRVAICQSTVHATWYDERDSNYEIYYKRYPDFPPDTSPPSHSNETPPPDSYRDAPGTNISVHVTDPSGVNETTIQLYVNGSLATHTSTPITDGFNVSFISPGFDPGVVTCQIVADDNYSNTLDYTWNFTVLALYEIQLQEGWNLISVPHVQVDTTIDEVLRDIDGKWNYIQWYDASDPVDKWKTNATFKPQQLNDLFVINRTMAFWINITEPNVNLTVRGLYPGSTTIPLYRGWNLVGYPSLDTETVGNALFGTTADRVEVCDISEPYNIREVGPEYLMKPGEGYWVHVVADSVWTIEW